MVISDLLGLEEAERAPVREWAQALTRVVAGGELPPEPYREAESAKSSLLEFLGTYQQTHAGHAGSLISILVEAEAEGDQLSIDELLSFTVFLYTAGSGPTAYMLGNTVAALLAHPGGAGRPLAPAMGDGGGAALGQRDAGAPPLRP